MGNLGGELVVFGTESGDLRQDGGRKIAQL